jgi:hypothetical protein
VYGKQVLLQIEFQVRTFRIAAEMGLNLDEAQRQRALQLNELDEIRKDARGLSEQDDKINNKGAFCLCSLTTMIVKNMSILQAIHYRR